MKAIWSDTVITESESTVSLEGTQYFPFASIKEDFFKANTRISTCGWEGLASYYSIDVNGKVNTDAAWMYKTPKVEAVEIEDHIAFWKGVTVLDQFSKN